REIPTTTAFVDQLSPSAGQDMPCDRRPAARPVHRRGMSPRFWWGPFSQRVRHPTARPPVLNHPPGPSSTLRGQHKQRHWRKDAVQSLATCRQSIASRRENEPIVRQAAGDSSHVAAGNDRLLLTFAYPLGRGRQSMRQFEDILLAGLSLVTIFVGLTCAHRVEAADGSP